MSDQAQKPHCGQGNPLTGTLWRWKVSFVPPPPNSTDATPPWVVAPTEERNPETVDIDLASTLDLLRMINDEDAKVPAAVRAVLPALAAAVDLATVALRAGHCVHYFGAGTSGRIAMMDAAELTPTFGT